jgi:pimeloyl-ACP methyl ester carboxylesterase
MASSSGNRRRSPLFDDPPEWLHDDGFDVWIAHWDSAPFWPFTPLPGWTAPIETSGKCLAGQVATVKQKTGYSGVILIAHSMGGPVSRACLQSDTYTGRQDVDTLITLGSPHGGIMGLSLLNIITGLLAIYCFWQPAFCQMDPDYMALFNGRYERNFVKYYRIGGDGEEGPMGGICTTSMGPTMASQAGPRPPANAGAGSGPGLR